MADPKDVQAAKYLRSELGKKMIDVTSADVRVMHGIAYVRGVVKGVRGGPTDLKATLNLAAAGLRQKGIIKDIVIDCSFRS